MKRLLLFGLLAGLLATNTGCGLCHAIFCYRPCRGFGGCGDCDEGCGPACGVARSNCGVCAPQCDEGCDTGCARPCGEPCAPACGRCWYRGPVSCLFALFRPCTWRGCGCGERYWGDFYSDPPDCWDPCDCHGNYNGAGHCAGGCAEGPGVFDGYADGGVPAGSVVSDRAVGPSPTPASQPHKAAR